MFVPKTKIKFSNSHNPLLPSRPQNFSRNLNFHFVCVSGNAEPLHITPPVGRTTPTRNRTNRADEHQWSPAIALLPAVEPMALSDLLHSTCSTSALPDRASSLFISCFVLFYLSILLIYKYNCWFFHCS